MRERGRQNSRTNNQRPSSHERIGLWRRLALALLHEWIGLGRVVLNVNVVVVKVHFVVAVLLLLLLMRLRLSDREGILEGWRRSSSGSSRTLAGRCRCGEQLRSSGGARHRSLCRAGLFLLHFQFQQPLFAEIEPCPTKIGLNPQNQPSQNPSQLQIPSHRLDPTSWPLPCRCLATKTLVRAARLHPRILARAPAPVALRAQGKPLSSAEPEQEEETQPSLA